MSEAEALTVMVPLTVLPLAGAVKETLGGVESIGGARVVLLTKVDLADSL